MTTFSVMNLVYISQCENRFVLGQDNTVVLQVHTTIEDGWESHTMHLIIKTIST